MTKTTATVYWRPGCPYCEHLMSGLDPQDARISYRNIWEDEAAAKTVRGLQNGNELVPTVTIGDRVLTAPDAREVERALAQAEALGL